jgi:HEAT repeat protein
MRWLLPVVLALACACGDHTESEARANVTLLLNQEGSEAHAASERLAKLGARAIPTIEAAMHTASPSGRKNLILALRKIGDAEAVPLLRHIAIYDKEHDVRREAEWTLKQWAAGEGARAEKSRAALRTIAEARSSEGAG